jgi:hypothetical protein
LIWEKTLDGSPSFNWFVIGIIPIAIAGGMFGLMYLVAQSDSENAHNPQASL